MSQKIIIGNWKMNPQTVAHAKRIFSHHARTVGVLKHTKVVLCVPSVYLHALRELKGASRLSLGAQDVFFEKEGSHTGEIGVSMLKDAGVTHVIVGHSERRTRGETDDVINKKLHAVVNAGLTAVVCVGEEDRDTEGAFYRTLEDQIRATLKDVENGHASKIIIAYEPVWAIGASSDEAMDGDRMYEMMLFIRKVLTDMCGAECAQGVRIIYGGSADASNVEDIITQGHIDGVLPGRASLDGDEFKKMMMRVDAL